MTATDTRTPRYQRSDGVLWRDTGQYVLVLAPGDDGAVTLLGGGSAALWRLLGRRHSLPEIVAAFVDHQGTRPAEHEIADAVADLTARGLLRVEGARGR
ncbi:MAG: hypothetical protein GEU96_00475 [Propionibacteriales bacterium]|nr:hypothetical protein [Propionibacteriales bacterium]